MKSGRKAQGLTQRELDILKILWDEMMKKSNSSGWRRCGGLLLVPAIALGLAITNIPVVASILHDAGAEGVNLAASSNKDDANLSADEILETPSAGITELDAKPVFANPEKQAEYPGGINAMIEFLAHNLQYPEAAVNNNIEGRVIVRFVVQKDGSIGETTIVKSVSPELDAEAIRVVKLMPCFTPGMINNEPVAVYYNLPISFKLPKEPATEVKEEPAKLNQL